MPKQFDLLVFDWDGTLMDSAATIVASIQAASRDIGVDEPSDEAARHIIGLGLNEAIATLFPAMAQADYAKLNKAAKDICDATADGLNYFLEKNPQVKP
ncbi:MAG: HAD hydrolase-like protein, partial [Sulfurimicrobium sp.]